MEHPDSLLNRGAPFHHGIGGSRTEGRCVPWRWGYEPAFVPFRAHCAT